MYRIIFTSGLLMLLALPILAQNTSINTIDDLSIEKSDGFVKLDQETIKGTTILAFDIPEVLGYIEDNGLELDDVTLLIENQSMPQFPAFIEGDDGLIRFQYQESSLGRKGKDFLLSLPGDGNKNVLLGIKFGEKLSLTYGKRATLYFAVEKTWSNIGDGLIVVVLLFFVIIIYKHPSIIKNGVAPLGDHKPTSASYSLGRSQLAFWSIIVICSFIYIFARTGDISSINTTALILLGISAVTTTASNAINNQEERKAHEADTQNGDDTAKQRLANLRKKANFLRDVLSDSNGYSIHRMQSFVFNIIFAFAFVRAVLGDFTMPTFDEVQLGLLGLSNGTYAFLKNSENA